MDNEPIPEEPIKSAAELRDERISNKFAYYASNRGAMHYNAASNMLFYTINETNGDYDRPPKDIRKYHAYTPNSIYQEFSQKESIIFASDSEHAPYDLEMFYSNEKSHLDTHIKIDKLERKLEYTQHAVDQIQAIWENNEISYLRIQPTRDIPRAPRPHDMVTEQMPIVTTQEVLDEIDNGNKDDENNEKKPRPYKAYTMYTESSVDLRHNTSNDPFSLLFSGEQIELKPDSTTHIDNTNVPNKYIFSYDKEKDVIVIRRYGMEDQHTEILLDTVTINRHVTIQELRHDLVPDELVNDPLINDISLDKNWRNLPAIRKLLGITWIPSPARLERNQAYIKEKVDKLNKDLSH